MTTYGSSSGSGDSPPSDAQDTEKPHPLGVGHRLDEFELLEVIGEGGFGIVYRAYDHSLQREVAIKEYMPSMLARRVGDNSVHVRSERLTATFQAGLRSFINEARTLAQFSHPALVRVHRFWESNSTAYMAIQLYRGRTLRRLAEEEPSKITERWLLGMLGPLLGALETLHRNQCFHRDIAPDNIFLQHDDLPVLLDFGAARKSIADLVDEVAVMVKSGYSPIEQYADDNTLLQGAWTDMYALGAVLYRAVTGHPPPSAVVRSVQDAYVPLSSMGRSDLSPGFCAAVDHTLAVHSKDRTQTVAVFAAELGLVKLGDIYVNAAAAPTVIIPSAPVPATPPPPPLSPMPAPLETTAVVAQPAAVAEPVQTQPPARPPRAVPNASGSKPVAQKKAPALARWSLVGGLLIALVAVGAWIGLRMTSGKPDMTTAVVPMPPPAAPMSNPAAPPAAMPAPGTSAPGAGPPATDGTPSAGGATVISDGTAMPPAVPASASAQGPLTPLENVPVTTPSAEAQAAVPPPVPPQAPNEVEDWNIAQAENSREGYEAYLRRYRRGPHARDARNAIAELNRLSAISGAPSTAASPGMGRVQFNIRPWGQVFVDGADRGVSPPLKTLPLRPGIYNIEVRNGDLEVYRQRVTVQDSRSAPVVVHEFK